MSTSKFNLICLTAALILLAGLGALWLAVPLKDGERDFYGQIFPGGWMAWTFPVALFFWCIISLLVTMTLLAIRCPETPRVGILRTETTRGDRLFISLLGSAFIALIWLYFAGPPVWGALILGLLWAAAVFALV